MSELISKEAALKVACDTCQFVSCPDDDKCDEYEAMKNLPSAEPNPYCPMAGRLCDTRGKEFVWCLTCPHISEEDRTLVKKAVEPKKGRWIEMVDADPMTGEPYVCGVYCSECGERIGCESNFCPNCGAKMLGEDGEA